MPTIVYTICTILTISSCSYDFKETSTSEEKLDASVDFSKFYVIGDRYTSGFMDGALYSDGQQHSYPNLFAQKLDSIFEKNVFQQPLIDSESGFNPEASDSDKNETKGKYNLHYPESNSIYPRLLAEEGESLSPWEGSAEELNDFSVPGLQSYQMEDLQKLQQNKFFNRLSLSKNLLNTLVEQNPGVVLLSIGNDDVLSYALAGGVGDENPDPENITPKDLTPISLFRQSLEEATEKIINESDAHIFITNIFNPLYAPYFTTMDIVLEPSLFSSRYVGYLRQYYEEFNNNIFKYNYIEEGGVPLEERRPIIDFDPMNYPNLGTNGRRVIYDEYLSEIKLNDGTEMPKWRMLNEGEIILYKTEGKMTESSGLGTETPLSDAQVLTNPEIEIIEGRVSAYNQLIENLASQSNRITLVDIHTIIERVNNGEYFYNGVNHNVEFDRRSIFSADGYTLNPRGNAIIRNQLIRNVNEDFDADLRLLSPNKLRGINFIFE